MLIKKSAIGTKFVHLMTSSPFAFLAYVALGVSIILFLSVTTKLDVMQTYPATLDENALSLIIANCTKIDAMKVFVYENRNESVVDTPVLETTMSGADCIVRIDGAMVEKLRNAKGTLFVDVPVAKESLLQRVFAKGGMMHD
jgi:hypothetical protein